MRTKPVQPEIGFWAPTAEAKSKLWLNDIFPLAFAIYGAAPGRCGLVCTYVFHERGGDPGHFLYFQRHKKSEMVCSRKGGQPLLLCLSAAAVCDLNCKKPGKLEN